MMPTSPSNAPAPLLNALATASSGKPAENPARNVWVQETALATALNTSYMAERISVFGIVVGIALLLSGFGFAILAFGGALRNRDSALADVRSHGSETVTPPAAA